MWRENEEVDIDDKDDDGNDGDIGDHDECGDVGAAKTDYHEKEKSGNSSWLSCLMGVIGEMRSKSTESSLHGPRNNWVGQTRHRVNQCKREWVVISRSIAVVELN